MTVRLTKELQQQIANDYDNGLSPKELATKYDISEPRVQEFCNWYERIASLAEALAKLGNEHPELRPNIAEKLHEMGVLPDKSKIKSN
jgi:hypothetical protein